ncbi:MAG TPA: hypothetical protein VFN31_02720 [Candidatus Saccharimonadales bacterium]|nr:hypothetical protein [Candidatus Saccharimonadales bacterium]
MKKLKFISLPLLALILAYVVFAVFIHKPVIKPAYKSLSFSTSPNLAWPPGSEAAVGIVGTNILNVNGVQTPKPTASTAKLITALMVLKAKPLSLNEQGPTLTMTQSDVDIYNKYVAENGSVAQVAANEQISEYQMLQGMLLPSANNMADSLAIWAYGSLPAYSSAANSFLAGLGLKDTHVGTDASGFDPSTVSTAADLVKIGELVMQDPVLSSIVNQPTANIPVAGVIRNVNNLLGQDNIVGVKTGNTDQAGGVFVGAAKLDINNTPTTVVTANVGTKTLGLALTTSLPLLRSAQANFHNTILANQGTVVATYTTPWNKQSVSAITSQPITATVWGGTVINLPEPRLASIKSNARVNEIVGKLSDSSIGSTVANVSLAKDLSKPSIWWLLTHP